jgi:uncharacterized phage protein (TIGR01671 family)
MKREIKFRAWSKKDQFMHTVGEIHFCQGGLLVFGSGVFIGNNCVNDQDITLMQYTGIKDKNGVEIYEGDILRTEIPPSPKSRYDVMVVFDQLPTPMGWYGVYLNIDSEPCHMNTVIHYTSKVIGNIHENSELMKGTL